MKTLPIFGMAFALLLASTTTVLAADPLPSTADILRGPYYGPTQAIQATAPVIAPVMAPVMADVLRSPYYAPTKFIKPTPPFIAPVMARVRADVLRTPYYPQKEEAPAVADVLREGYEELWPYVAVGPK